MYDNSSLILSQVKSLLVQLRPYGLQGGEERDIALEQALRELVRQRQARADAALDCKLTVALGQAVIPQRLAVAVYRIAQEALTNVMRHAQASEVVIRVEYHRDSQSLKLTVADNGIGFDPASTVSGNHGLGLVGIRERVLANQGSLRYAVNQPSGVIMEAEFPLQNGEDDVS